MDYFHFYLQNYSQNAGQNFENGYEKFSFKRWYLYGHTIVYLYLCIFMSCRCWNFCEDIWCLLKGGTKWEKQEKGFEESKAKAKGNKRGKTKNLCPLKDEPIYPPKYSKATILSQKELKIEMSG